MKISGLLFICLFISVPVLNGSETIRMQVSPAVARAPALLTVRVRLQPAADDRYLQVVAESPDFYRSSEVPIEAANSARLRVFEFRNLPTGLYRVTSVLVGANGRRAEVTSMARVDPSFGLAR